MRGICLLGGLGCLQLLPHVSADCLPDAIPAGERTRTINVDGIQKPLGLVMNQAGPSNWLTSVFEILASEVMGYATVNSTVSTRHDFYKVSGCLNPEAEFVTDMQCGAASSDWHVSLETRRPNETFMAEFPEYAAVPVSSIGYVGTEGLMAFSRELETAWESAELVLQHYQGFDADAFEVWHFFDGPSVFSGTDLALCSNTYVHASRVASWHVQFTGDSEGVEFGDDGQLRYKCWNGTWWLAPACRNATWKCIATIGDHTGYDLPALMQKAAMGNMPLAIAAAATFDKYVELVRGYRVLVYLWLPQHYFSDMQPKFIMFDLNNELAWSQGDLRTFGPIRAYYKYAWHGLEAADLRLFSAVKNMRIGDVTIHTELFYKQMFAETFYEAACRWLTNNVETWAKWIPDPADCTQGSGMVDGSGNYTSNFTLAVGCRACMSGMFSFIFDKVAGTNGRAFTYVCKPCPLGHAQGIPGMGRCDACFPGSYASTEGKSECTTCQVGRFQAETNSTGCEACPSPYTTMILGADSEDFCVCPRDMYLSLEGHCNVCPRGMSCEINSVEANFPTLSGARSPACLSDTAELCRYPMLLPKYYSSRADPLNVFLCSSDVYCPGGEIQQCGEHMHGIACGVCETGYAREENHACGKCADIESTAWFFPWLPSILAPAAIVVLHSRSQDDVELWNSNTALLQGVCQVGLSYLQTVSIINTCYIKAPSLWADSTGWTAKSLDFLDTFRPACSVMPDFRSEYVLKMLFPVFVLLEFLFTFGVCRLLLKALPAVYLRLHSVLDLNKDVLFHCYGSLLFTFYISISAMALSLFQCYDHPNGERSMISSPAVLCGSQEWQDVLIAAIFAVLVFCVFFLVTLVWAMVMAPTRFSNQGFRTRWKFALMKFRPTSWWWGLVVMLKGIWLNLTTVLFNNSVDQVLWLNAGMVGYFCWTFTRQPWRCLTVTIVDLAQHAFLLLLFGCLPYFVAEQTSVDRLGIIAVAICSVPIVFTSCVIIVALRWIFLERRQREAGMVRKERKNEARALLHVFAMASNQHNSDHVATVLQSMAFADLMVLRSARDVLLTELNTGMSTPRKAASLTDRSIDVSTPVVSVSPSDPHSPAEELYKRQMQSQEPGIDQPLFTARDSEPPPPAIEAIISQTSSEDEVNSTDSGASFDDMDFEVDVPPEGFRCANSERIQQDGVRGASAWRERGA